MEYKRCGNIPRRPEEVRRATPPAFSLKVRQKLKLSRDKFALIYRIPYSTLCSWDRSGRKPQSIGIILLKMIEADPEGVAAIVAKTDVELQPTWRQKLKKPKPNERLFGLIKMEERVA